MNATISNETPNGGSLHPVVSPRCEWITSKGQVHTECGEPAKWQKGAWKLCDHHKQRLIESYNATWRAKETPEWVKI